MDRYREEHTDVCWHVDTIPHPSVMSTQLAQMAEGLAESCLESAGQRDTASRECLGSGITQTMTHFGCFEMGLL